MIIFMFLQAIKRSIFSTRIIVILHLEGSEDKFISI